MVEETTAKSLDPQGTTVSGNFIGMKRLNKSLRSRINKRHFNPNILDELNQIMQKGGN